LLAGSIANRLAAASANQNAARRREASPPESSTQANAAAAVAAVAILSGLLSVDWFGMRRATSGFAAFTDALDMLDTGNADAATVKLEAIRRSGSVSVPELYISLARAYVKRGHPEDHQAILEVAEEGLRLFPDEPELLWYAALGSFSTKQWEPARGYIERYLALKPTDMRAIYIAFATAMAQGRIDDARAYLVRAEAIDKTNPLTEEMRNTLGAAAP